MILYGMEFQVTKQKETECMDRGIKWIFSPGLLENATQEKISYAKNLCHT